jgi:hypothetical protein
MKKRSILFIALMLSLVMALAFSSLGMAAQLSNNIGLTLNCPEGQVGHWHFVSNQTGGAAAGQLIATFGDTGQLAAVGPTKVLGSTQHFVVEGPLGPLQGAYTLTGNGLNQLPGKLVLSDWSCVGDKKDPPKK